MRKLHFNLDVIWPILEWLGKSPVGGGGGGGSALSISLSFFFY